jgi:hypothetical protein
MSYKLDPARIYRMPTHFGPSLGPRQGLHGDGYACSGNPCQLVVEASFEADAQQLSALMPPQFEPLLPARLTASFSYITEIEWLAGRGYNTFGIRIPARYRGARDEVEGEFCAVLWENRPEPIITGREELGISKLYCELPEPERAGSGVKCVASWEETIFAVLDVSALAPATPLSALPGSAGLLHYKYMPRTGQWGQADVQYAVLTPAETPNLVIEASERGNARLEFRPASWEAVPTLYREISALAELRIGACIHANVLRARGYKDLRDQTILG